MSDDRRDDQQHPNSEKTPEFKNPLGLSLSNPPRKQLRQLLRDGDINHRLFFSFWTLDPKAKRAGDRTYTAGCFGAPQVKFVKQYFSQIAPDHIIVDLKHEKIQTNDFVGCFGKLLKHCSYDPQLNRFHKVRIAPYGKPGEVEMEFNPIDDLVVPFIYKLSERHTYNDMYRLIVDINDSYRRFPKMWDAFFITDEWRYANVCSATTLWDLINGKYRQISGSGFG